MSAVRRPEGFASAAPRHHGTAHPLETSVAGFANGAVYVEARVDPSTAAMLQLGDRRSVARQTANADRRKRRLGRPCEPMSIEDFPS